MMFHSGWVLERYLGWSLLHEEPDLKLLMRRHGPIRRFLMLDRTGTTERADALAGRQSLFGVLSEVTIVDFAASTTSTVTTLGDHTLRKVSGPCWFGAGTFVLDLSQPVDALWKGISSRERSKARAAEREGASVRFTRDPDSSDVDDFLAIYTEMAVTRSLQAAPRAAIRRMLVAGDALLATCLDRERRPQVSNLIYGAGSFAIFLYGARREPTVPGSGHLIHWETARHLKAAGVPWYDLGLVPSIDPNDGLYRFKRSFGGEFVAHGVEFRYRSPLLRFPLWVRSAATRTTPRSGE